MLSTFTNYISLNLAQARRQEFKVPQTTKNNNNNKTTQQRKKKMNFIRITKH